jgi:APA family basic amino acid/polyamine antiporter
MFFGRLFRTKSLASLSDDPLHEGRGLRRVLGPVDLILLGIGGIVGAGIFALVGSAAAGDATRLGAGPALIVSFALTGLACALAGLCYAEFASLAPISGSAYTYAYATLGEIVAWIIGWDLILEYAVGNVAVAVSWSGYFCEFLHSVGIEFPRWLASDWRTAYSMATPSEVQAQILDAAPQLWGVPLVFNLPAVFIVTALSTVLVLGIRESAWFNAVMVAIKLVVLGFFVVIGSMHVDPDKWHPFAPNGWAGIQAGAAVVFFAFIGFDAVSTTAEECRNPKRDLPIGILGSLVICTLIYVAVAAVLTGVVSWTELNTAEPLSVAMRQIGLNWAAGIVAFGSLVAHTAVLLVFQLGQPRILLAMSRDGLLPPAFGKVHPRFKTPHMATIATGVFVAGGAAIASLDEMADLCNIGTLSAFLIVCIGILVLRNREPDRPRPFRCPWVPWVPLLGALACLALMAGLPRTAWIRFVAWLLLGLMCFFAYGLRKSRLNHPLGTADPMQS